MTRSGLYAARHVWWPLLALVALALLQPWRTSSAGADPTVTVTVLREEGGRVDWSHTRNLIVFDARNPSGDFQVFTMNPNGTNQTCLTCQRQHLQGRHVGNPDWYPNGNYLVLQMEKAVHQGEREHATPGLGINNDIWIMNAAATAFTRITNVPEGMGVLHPHFSNNGQKLSWAERVADTEVPTGAWVIRVADIVPNRRGMPQVTTIDTYAPLGPVLYETHGFTPGNTGVIFTAHRVPDPVTGDWMDIYAMNLSTQTVVPLTQSPGEWDEHAQYSPDGQRVLWMSSLGCSCAPGQPDDLHTDFWIMTSYGTYKTRLTYFSLPGHPHYTEGERSVAADSAWSPDGLRAVVYVQRGEPNRPYDGRIALLTFGP